MRPRRRRWASCYHEAGHAVAIWQSGYQFEYVAVQPCRVLEADLGGCVFQSPFITHPKLLDPQRAREIDENPAVMTALLENARNSLFVYVAGPAADARYQRRSIDYALINGGSSDVQISNDTMDVWFPNDRDNTWSLVVERCRLFVRTTLAWRWITAVAEKLYADGVLSFAEVDSICSDIWPRWLIRGDGQIRYAVPPMPPKAPHPDRWAAAQLSLDL